MNEITRFNPEEKAEIILLTLRSPGHIGEICRERQISPITFSKWKKKYLAGGLEALSKGGPMFENELVRENQKLKETIGHLFVELEFLKKKLGMGR